MAIRIVTHDVEDAKRLYTVSEARRMLSLSRSTIYEVMRSGRLLWVKEKGAPRLIPATALDEYEALLKREAADRAKGAA
jgi:excisionase family DNA binding protein